jgi:uncharacterized protein (TIGR02147 family)
MQNSIKSADFRLWLQAELTQRCQKNPRYSLRAFSRLLDMDASSISQIRSGKRKVSTKVIENICESLSAPPIQKKIFLQNLNRKQPLLKKSKILYELIEQDTFACISDWYHFAILEMTNLKIFQNSVSWISKRLGITETEVKIALDRLKRLKLIEEKNSTLIRKKFFLTNFSPGITSAAHKKLQRQLIQKALDAIDTCRQEEKDITSMTMSIDVTKLPEARKIITDFRRKMSDFLEEGNRNSVYQLTVQLYPLTKN